MRPRQSFHSSGSDSTSEPLGGTIKAEASALAKTFDLVCFDRFAGCRFELHHIVAITEKDARYGDSRLSVRCGGAELLVAALIMHVPAHQLKSS